MVESFPRTLSYLRKEKKISQKEAASSLGISQALLSHYENGLREPGLEFAVKAARYYGVSADYLLGISGERNGGKILPEALPDTSSEKETSRGDNSSLTIQKKIAVNSISLLFDLLERIGSKELLEQAGAYLNMAVYKLFRHLYAAGEQDDRFFSIPYEEAQMLSDAEMHRTEGLVKTVLRGKGKTRSERPEMLLLLDEKSLHRDFHAGETSLLVLLRMVGDRLERLLKF